jgi:hypothetical protein
MSIDYVALAALLAVHLIFSSSPAPAQTAPSGGTEMATGDVWISRGERIYVPREALELPRTLSPGDIEMATGDVWISRDKPIAAPQQVLAPDIVHRAEADNR